MKPANTETTIEDKRKSDLKMNIRYSQNSMSIFSREHNNKIRTASYNTQSKQIDLKIITKRHDTST